MRKDHLIKARVFLVTDTEINQQSLVIGTCITKTKNSKSVEGTVCALWINLLTDTKRS